MIYGFVWISYDDIETSMHATMQQHIEVNYALPTGFNFKPTRLDIEVE